MKLFRNGKDAAEMQALKDEFSQSRARVQEAAKRLARGVETVTRQKKERELAESIARFRINEGAAE